MPLLTPSSPIPLSLSLNVRVEKCECKTSAVLWWVKFMALLNMQGLTEQRAMFFPPFSSSNMKSLIAMHMTSINRFKPVSHYATDPFYFTRGDTKSVVECIQRVSLEATDIKVDSPKMMGRIMSGFMPNIRADFICHNPTTMEHCWQNTEPLS